MGRKANVQDILEKEDEDSPRWWCSRARRGRLKTFVLVARSIRWHWKGITVFLRTRVTNGRIEAINGIIQLAKSLARGFRNFACFRAIASLKAANLTLTLPQLEFHLF